MDGERARTLLKFELKLSGGLEEEEDGQQDLLGGPLAGTRALLPVAATNRD